MFNFFDKCYIPQGIPWDEPRISPAFADASLFPPSVTLISASHDLLAGEVHDLNAKLSLLPRIDVVHYSAEGQDHGWDKGSKAGSEAARIRDEAYDLAASRIKQELWK